MIRASDLRNAKHSGKNRRNPSVIVVAVIVFFVLGFVLPTVVTFAAMSIPAAVDPNAARIGIPQVPIQVSLITGALMAAGAGIGLMRRASRSSSMKRGRRQTAAGHHSARNLTRRHVRGER